MNYIHCQGLPIFMSSEIKKLEKLWKVPANMIHIGYLVNLIDMYLGVNMP